MRGSIRSSSSHGLNRIKQTNMVLNHTPCMSISMQNEKKKTKQRKRGVLILNCS